MWPDVSRCGLTHNPKVVAEFQPFYYAVVVCGLVKDCVTIRVKESHTDNGLLCNK